MENIQSIQRTEAKEKAASRKDSRGRVLRTGEGQRGDGSYQFRWSENGSRCTVYAPTLEGLRQKEDDIARQRLLGRLPAEDSITVGQLAERHMQLCSGLRERTKRCYRNTLSHLRQDELWNRHLRDVTVGECKLYLVRLQAGGLCFETIRNEHAFLSSVFKSAVEDGCAAWNPFSFRLGFLAREPKKEREALTGEQQAALLDFMAGDSYCRRYRDLFLVLLHTGLRVGECAGLTAEDICLTEGFLQVDHQVYYSPEQGGMVWSPPKTEKSCRKIPLTAPAAEALERRLIIARGLDRCEVIGHRRHFLFPCLNGSRPLHGADFDRIFGSVHRRYNESGSVPIALLTPHILRHTFCTALVRRGLDIKSVQYLMGHASAGVTLDVYSHVNYSDVREKLLALAP